MKDNHWQMKFRQCGCKLTSARESIMNVLNNNQGHLSADEVFFLVKKECKGIGIATVYRTLDILTQTGIIHKFDFGDGCCRYELASKDEKEHHHHLICTKCGKITDYNNFMDQEKEFLKKLEKELSNVHNFKIEAHQIYFYGLCEKCQKNQ